MNYLAHLFCSADSPEGIAGALLGDFAKGSTHESYSPHVRRAIELHRSIDRFTDRHPRFQASCSAISPTRRRFAPILIDVFYDHLLVRHWRRFAVQSLDEFTTNVYTVLASQCHWYPERLRRVVPRMIDDDWLCAYGRREGVQAALRGIARRLARYPRAAVLRDATEELDREYGRIESDFLAFFPQLVVWADQEKKSLYR